jgi:hypothetical protein
VEQSSGHAREFYAVSQFLQAQIEWEFEITFQQDGAPPYWANYVRQPSIPRHDKNPKKVIFGLTSFPVHICLKKELLAYRVLSCYFKNCHNIGFNLLFAI